MGVAVKAEWIAQSLNGSRERTAQEIVRELENLIGRAESAGLDLGAHLLEAAAQHFRVHAGDDEYRSTPESPSNELV